MRLVKYCVERAPHRIEALRRHIRIAAFFFADTKKDVGLFARRIARRVPSRNTIPRVVWTSMQRHIIQPSFEFDIRIDSRRVKADQREVVPLNMQGESWLPNSIHRAPLTAIVHDANRFRGSWLVELNLPTRL